MKQKVFGLLFMVASVLYGNAQKTRFIVQLKDKAGTPYSLTDPSRYLSQRSIERRARYQIALDSTDLPVVPRYLDSIRSAGAVTVLNVSKWLNQVTIQTTDAAAIQKINSFPFVQGTKGIAAQKRPGDLSDPAKQLRNSVNHSNSYQQRTTGNYFNYGMSQTQISMHNGIFLHNIGLRGQGMVIGMFDAGFFNYTSLKAFDSVNANKQVLDTWDFVAREKSVTEDHPHGMNCFSIIAANVPGEFTGSAPKSGFYLYRTEDAASEYPIEEHNWVSAAEKLDSAGGDVISSSLGYYIFDDPSLNYTYAQMDGNTTISARGADAAAKKGILVVNAAGNSGNEPWKYIITPADGDSVLAVGAVTAGGLPAGFSSYGPSADGQVKPDVASLGVGTTIQATNNTITTGNGTSFSCPNMAGLATCLWQGFPEFSNMKIIQALRMAGNNYTTPNDRTGYGITDVKKALTGLLQEFSQAAVSPAGCQNKISWTSKDVAGMFYEVERKSASDTGFIKIGTLAGSGPVFSTHSYSFTDPLLNLAEATISYRIRQVVDTAASSFTSLYLDTIRIATESCNLSGNDKNKVQVTPNPNNGEFSVRITDTQPVQQLKIVVFSMRGEAVASFTTTKPSGVVAYPFTLKGLQRGVYTVALYHDGRFVTSEKFTKL